MPAEGRSAERAGTSPASGIVTSASLCERLADVRVTRLDAHGKTLGTCSTDAKGAWHLPDTAGTPTLRFAKDGYTTKEIPLPTGNALIRLLENDLIGYAMEERCFPGERVRVCIHAVQGFRVALYRYGLTCEKRLDLGSFAAAPQSVPDDFFVETGLRWAPTLSIDIPRDARPGLYGILLESERQSERFVIPLVVSTPPRERGSRAPLLVLANTNTWSIYNVWGGRSRYRNFESLKAPAVVRRTRSRDIFSRLLPLALKEKLYEWFFHAPPAPWEVRKLSTRRPFPFSGLKEDHSPSEPFSNHLGAAEWRTLAWLEREGIPYDYAADLDLHLNPEMLEHYRALLISSHSEYWTQKMFVALKRFHENHGLWIMNLGGNTCYGEIALSEDGTVEFRDDFRRSGQDESSLFAVRTTLTDFGTSAPYRIVAVNHWVFRDTSLAAGELFGKTSLNCETARQRSGYDPGRIAETACLSGSGASGWETDKRVASTPAEVTLLAKGLNPGGGAEMVLREPRNSRGGLFAVGSILFSGALLIDATAGKIVQNVLERALGKSAITDPYPARDAPSPQRRES